MAAPCRAHDKKHFPGADVVRVGSQRWLTQPQHKETLDELVAEATGFVEARRGVAFDELVREYEKHEPRHSGRRACVLVIRATRRVLSGRR